MWLRESVWSRLTPFVKPGMHVLDLGCGTGEDALWLARNACRVTAADGSPAMLEQVAAKAARLKLDQRLRTLRLDLNAPEDAEPPTGHPFDLVISNFGAINCVDDLSALGRKLVNWVKPGGVVALIFMGRFCAWEIRLLPGALRCAGGTALVGQSARVRREPERPHPVLVEA